MDAPAVQYVRTSDGLSIAYAIDGQGTPMVRTPGAWGSIPLSVGVEQAEFKAFADRFAMTYYDARGQGLSSRGLPESTTLDDFVTDLESVVERTQPGRFFLYGSGNYMGAIAIKYASMHPDRLIGLVLRNFVDSKAAAYAAPFREIAARDWDAFLGIVIPMNFPRAEASSLKRLLAETLTQQDLIIMNRCMRSLSAEDLLPQIRIPTLVMASRLGTIALPAEETARRLASTIPQAKLVLFDGIDPVTEDGIPETLYAIESFVDGLKPGRQTVPLLGQASSILSARELDVLRLIAVGRSNAQIAQDLVISPNTVGRHISNIFDKTGVANRTEAAAYARDHGVA